MKIAVIGAGAIGCVTGALLWEKGYDVVLVGRRNQVEAINSNGLVIDGYIGEKLYRVPAKTSLDFEPGMAILTVKTQDVEDACREILPWSKDAVVVTMQNGVKSDEIAAEVLGRDRIISAVVMFGATYLKPGRVTYNFPASGLIIGRAFGEKGSLLEEAHEVLSSGFEVHVSLDIHGAHWTKLILNLSNALAGVLGMSLQEVFKDHDLCRLGVMLMKEAYEAMEEAGIRLASLPDLTVEKLKSLLDAPVEVSAGIYGTIMRGLSKEDLPGSILQSVRRGSASEVDYLNGEIAVLGLMRRHPTPLNYKVTRLMKDVEKSGRFMSKERLMKAVVY